MQLYTLPIKYNPQWLLSSSSSKGDQEVPEIIRNIYIYIYIQQTVIVIVLLIPKTEVINRAKTDECTDCCNFYFICKINDINCRKKFKFYLLITESCPRSLCLEQDRAMSYTNLVWVLVGVPVHRLIRRTLLFQANLVKLQPVPVRAFVSISIIKVFK